MFTLEPRIRPLVDALNATGLVRTFSSCEGHFAPDEQTLTDRNRAYVQFVPAVGVSAEAVERLLGFLLTRFKAQYGVLPIRLSAAKRFTALDETSIDETYVLELQPFNRFDPPAQKRADTDRAIGQVVEQLQAYDS